MLEDLVQNVVRVEKRVYNCMSARYVTDQPVCNSTVPCQQYKVPLFLRKLIFQFSLL